MRAKILLTFAKNVHAEKKSMVGKIFDAKFLEFFQDKKIKPVWRSIILITPARNYIGKKPSPLTRAVIPAPVFSSFGFFFLEFYGGAGFWFSLSRLFVRHRIWGSGHGACEHR